MIEVKVFMNSVAWQDNKSCFGRFVKCPECFNPQAFVDMMKCVFGSEIVVTFKYC